MPPDRSVLYQTASTLFAAPLDEGERLSELAQLFVPEIADWCIVDLVDPGPVLRRVAVAHADPGQAGLARDLSRRTPSDLLRETVLTRALESGRAMLFAHIEPQDLERVAADPEHLRLLREANPVSAIVVPLLVRGRAIGTITLLSAQSGRRFSAEDRSLAEELANRTAVAIENGRLYEQAQRAIRAREDLMAVVSHDLKNPLGAILMSAAMLDRAAPEGEDGDAVRRLALRIERAAERMNRLIRDLLDMTMLEAGRLSLERKRHPADALLAEAVDLIRPLANEKALRLEVADATPDTQVCCDRERILQTLSNLIGNAIQYTPEGGRIVVGAEPTKQYGDICFFVHDTGPGIPDNLLPHVFDRYWQAKKGDRQNIGLGLSIAKGIVEAHEGRLWAESPPGEGATFYFTLPTDT